MSITTKSIRTPVAGTLRGERTSSRWIPLAVVAAAHLMAILDVTVMFVALPSATVHGYAAAAAWGAGILLVLVVPIAALIDAGVPRRSGRAQAGASSR